MFEVSNQHIALIAFRLLLAALLSGLIGYEREKHGRAAGLRTTILVGVGSCLIMMTSMQVFELYKGMASIDPARIAAQVVSGIGFLGAGTIIRFKASVRGLTTAAGLWAVAGIGLAVGCGFYSAALLATFTIFLVLVLFSKVESRLRRDIYKVLKMEVQGGIDQLCMVRKILKDAQVEIKDMDLKNFPQENKFKLSLELKLSSYSIGQQITENISNIKGVIFVECL